VRTLRTIREVRAALTPARQSERRIALVPTMGAFHDGHVSLMRTARSEAEIVVVSLFVNPSQFGPDEDLARYPRMESDDAARASDIGVDFMFAPSVEEMYPPGFATSIDPGPVARGLWGTARPGHFAGVATVVARLFGIVAPDIAYFGLKDFQQVAVIRRLVADLALPIEIRALPTIREPDGLAMSSRNRYLSDDERDRARAIFDGLRAAAGAYAAGERDRRRLVDAARAVMEDAGITVEFVELRDAETLGPYSADRAAVLAVSARIGDTNLIDNLVLAPQLTAAPRKIETWST
jgi:pantoate--beta-alanine ligase